MVRSGTGFSLHFRCFSAALLKAGGRQLCPLQPPPSSSATRYAQQVPPSTPPHPPPGLQPPATAHPGPSSPPSVLQPLTSEADSHRPQDQAWTLTGDLSGCLLPTRQPHPAPWACWTPLLSLDFFNDIPSAGKAHLSIVAWLTPTLPYGRVSLVTLLPGSTP